MEQLINKSRRASKYIKSETLAPVQEEKKDDATNRSENSSRRDSLPCISEANETASQHSQHINGGESATNMMKRISIMKYRGSTFAEEI